MAKIDEARRARYRQEIESSSKTFVKVPYFKFDTSAKVRVLPGLNPSTPDGDFYVKVLSHYGVSPLNPKIPVTCPKTKNPKARCPVCDKIAELKATGNAADLSLANKLKVSARYPMNVVPRTGPDKGKVVVYTAPKTIVDKIIALTENPEYDDVNNAEEGTDLTFSKLGEGKDNTKYDVTPSRVNSPISEDPDEMADLLSGQYELWRFREAPSVNEIEEFMEGSLQFFTTGGYAALNAEANKPTKKTVVADSEEEEDKTPTTPVVLKKKVAKPAPVEDDEDDVPAPPKRKSNLASIRATLDKEDEED